jgi:lipopolysaccharide export system protein LptC
MNPTLRLQVLIDKIFLLMPVILMGLLALGSYWLYQNTPIVKENKRKVVLGSDPDYFLSEFSTRQYDAKTNLLNSEIIGEIANHYPDRDELEIFKIQAKAVSPEGFVTHGTAEKAIRNSDGNQVQLLGKALITREPLNASKVADGKKTPINFAGEYLNIEIDKQKITSNKAISVTQGGNQFTANNLEYDNKTGIVDLGNGVHVTLNGKTK